MNEQEFIRHQTDPYFQPQQALEAACRALGVSEPMRLARHGWGGPLQGLIHNPRVQEIIVPHDGQVWAVDNQGGRSAQPFSVSARWIQFLAEFWQRGQGRTPDMAEVIRDTLLFPNRAGIRYLYAPPGASAWGPSLYIRRLAFTDQPLTLAELVRKETLPAAAAETLRALLRAGTPMIISGATGAGKTTLLAALVHELQQATDWLNLLVVERSHEISLSKRAYRWAEGQGLALEHLAEKATQMGLDWLVLGECTGGEAYFVMKAYTQGVPVLSTLHAWSTVYAFKQLALLSQEYPKSPALKTVLDSMATLGLVAVQMERKIAGGRTARRVSGIAEIVGALGDEPVVNHWWQWDEREQQLRWNAGCINELGATTTARLIAAGVTLPVPQTNHKGRRP